MTQPKKNLSRKLDKAPPDIIARPSRVNLFILVKRLKKIIIAQEIPENIKITSGEPEKRLKAAPVLQDKASKKILAHCSINTQRIIIANVKSKIF